MSDPKGRHEVEDTSTTTKDDRDWSVADRKEWVEQYVKRAADAFDKRVIAKSK